MMPSTMTRTTKIQYINRFCWGLNERFAAESYEKGVETMTANQIKERFRIDEGMEVYLQFDGGGHGKERYLGGINGKILEISDDYVKIFERSHSYGGWLLFPDKVVYIETSGITSISRAPHDDEK